MENHLSGAERFYAVQYDLSNCDQEPIHIIRVVQSFACLLGVDPASLRVIHASENCSIHFGGDVEDLLSGTLDDLLQPEVMEQIHSGLREQDFLEINPIMINSFAGNLLDQPYHLIAHLQGATLILEFEKRDDTVSSTRFLQKSDRAVQKIQVAGDLNKLFHQTAEEVKSLTGYDRVMIYQFDEQYNGTVIAEAREEHLSPLLDLRYPASDIPQQARDLFLRNRVRMIVDTQSSPAMIVPALHPQSDEPLDLSDSGARGVSPIHIEYLNNMGVRASMSVSIIVEGKLWGLIACHHGRPKLVDYRLRNMIKFLGRIISGHLALQEAQSFREQRLRANIVRSHLFEQMSRNWSVQEGLLQNKYTLLDLNNAGGAALLLDGQLQTIGQCPPDDKILELIDWLNTQNDDSVFHTNALSEHWPNGAAVKSEASGLLSLRIAHTPPEYILWFRPEVIQTVKWGGNPEKAVSFSEENQRLRPRNSFEIWKQQMSSTALPWSKSDISSAIALRNDIKDIIIEKYQEIRQLNKELLSAYKDLESFSYSVSHDLRMPLRTIEGFSQILEEDYQDKLDEYGKQVIRTISSSIGKMNAFINDLLALSKISLNDLIINELDLRREISEQWEMIPEADRARVQLIIEEDLPSVHAEATALRQLLSNLLSNAVKYSRHREYPKIEVGGYRNDRNTIFYIRDNGIGIDAKHHERIFKVFSRLVSERDYEGTGVGLSIVRKVMDKHRGEIWVESELDRGATFYCSFPIAQ